MISHFMYSIRITFTCCYIMYYIPMRTYLFIFCLDDMMCGALTVVFLQVCCACTCNAYRAAANNAIYKNAYIYILDLQSLKKVNTRASPASFGGRARFNRRAFERMNKTESKKLPRIFMRRDHHGCPRA